MKFNQPMNFHAILAEKMMLSMGPTVDQIIAW